MKSPTPSPHSSKPDPNKLQPTSFWILFVCFSLLCLISFFFTKIWLRSGNVPLLVPRWTFLMPLLITCFVLWQGWNVRAYRQGKHSLSSLQAGRIWLLSQASSRTGALLSGSAAGILFCYLDIHGNDFLAQQVVNFLLVGIASLLLTVIGWLVERWCIVADDDDDSHSPGAGIAEPA